MKRLHALCLITICILFSNGCTVLEGRHLIDKGEEPFYSLRGKKVVVQRPIEIVVFTSDQIYGDTALILFAGNVDMEDIPSIIPKGTKITFDTFILERDLVFMLIPTRIEYEA